VPVVLLILALFGALLLVHPTRMSPLPARPGRASANPYGVLVGFGTLNDSSVIRGIFAQVGGAGIGWVRTDFFWDLIQPTPQLFLWDRYDLIVSAAREHSIELLGILDYSALWASSDPAGKSDKYPPRKVEDFVRYVEATVHRYRGSVKYWQVWNEPDHDAFWAGSAHEYATLLVATYPAIKSVDPSATVVFGGLAQGGRHDPVFLEEVLSKCGAAGGGCFDILAFHTNFRGMREIRAQFAHNRRVLARRGLQKPIWITESSYTSDSRYQALAAYQGGEQGQARYLVDAISLGLALGAERVFWASMHDHEREEGPYAGSGLVRPSAQPKRAYDAYRTLVARGRPGSLPRSAVKESSRP